MRWEHLRRSQNVEDRRHHRPSGRGTGGFKLGGFGIIIAIVLAIFVGPKEGLNFFLQNAGQQSQVTSSQVQVTGEDVDDTAEDFIKAVLGSTEDIWSSQFRQLGRSYQAPNLILYRGSTPMPGGHSASAAMGPFYYPADQTIYIDLSFFDDLARKYEAPGDFAQAYVIAHEVGHHVQHLLGLTERVHSKRGRVPQKEYNRASVRLELQADYLAGIWAHHEHQRSKILQRGDVQEALQAANAIGDDRLQKQAQGRIVPDSFTHGTSEQRMRWFSKGARSGETRALMQLFELPYHQL